MEVTHFEVRKQHGAFALFLHCIDQHGRKHTVLASDGRSTVMGVLIGRCRLNRREFMHLQRNSKP
jgi:hypothetical protein